MSILFPLELCSKCFAAPKSFAGMHDCRFERMRIILKYISVKEAAEKWGVSEVLVRRYCGQNRIPNAKYEYGTWLIPMKAKNP